jgi:hypothetical protein
LSQYKKSRSHNTKSTMKTVSLVSFLAFAANDHGVDAFAPINSPTSSSSSTRLMAIQTPPDFDAAYADLLVKLEIAGSMMKTVVSDRLQQINVKDFNFPLADILNEEKQAVAQVREAIAEIETAEMKIEEKVGTSSKPLVEKAVEELEVALTDMSKAVDMDADKLLGTAEKELEKGIADLEAATVEVVKKVPSMEHEATTMDTFVTAAVETPVPGSASSVLADVNAAAGIDSTIAAAVDTPMETVSFISSTITESSDSVVELAGSAVSEAVVQVSGFFVDVAEGVSSSLH